MVYPPAIMLATTFKKLVILECMLLFAQFLLGMSINLFTTPPLTNLFNFQGYTGGFEVLVHIIIGLLVLPFGVGIVAVSYKLNHPLVARLTILALIFTGWAIAAEFIFALGGQDDSFSAAMAGSYISIYTVYFVDLYLMGRSGKK